MSTCLPGQSDTQAASDLRAWSEEQLIAEAKTGKRAHFGELCERHVKRVFRVIHRIMRNREDAEDAVQDCLLNAFVHVKDQLQEHSLGETAQILGISTAAVKAQMFHARVALHRMPLLQSVGRSVRASTN